MENETYLFLAFLVTWLVFGAYLWSISRQVQSLNDEVKSIRGEAESAEEEERHRQPSAETSAAPE
jgi:CcmD family protein